MAETPVAPFSLDIANAESQKWGKAEWLTYFRDRLVKMRSRRPDAEYDNYENQVSAVSFYDNDGVLQVNVPLEKTLKEIYMGRTEGRVNFDIVPDGQANVEELQPSKYALTFFLDGNGRENFWRENKLFRDWKATYGHCIWYTGIRKTTDVRYALKEGESVESDTDLFAEGKFEKIENETWFFFPKAVHPKDFYVDDAAYGQPDMQYAEDCVMKEKVTMSELVSRYGKSKLYDIEGVTYWQDLYPKNKDDKPVDQRLIVLYHYFNKRTKKYLIVANEQQVVYDGIYLYDDGKLPFVNVQHYSNPNYFPGEGIPKRVAYLKAYKSEVFQDILAGSAMSSGLHLVVGNDDEIGQDWTLGGRQMNVWRTTGGADKVQQVNTSPNLGYFTSVLELIDKEIVMNSGDNPMDTVDPGSDKVGIVEIMESNKSVRRRSVDENYNMGLDDALTMTLARIKQFAPALLAKRIKDTAGKVLKEIFPSIRIDGFTVEKKQGKQTFVEDLGKFGYFELKPGVVRGIGVKIVTPSTNSVMPILERQKVNEYITNLSNLAAVAQFDVTGEMQRKLAERFPLEEVIGWMADAYGYDPDGLKANTKKDEIRKENLKKIDELKKLLSIQPQENAQQVPGAPGAAPTPAPQPNPAMPAGGQPQGMGWNSRLLSETSRLKHELNKGLAEASIENASLAARLSKAMEMMERLESENAFLRGETDALTKEVEKYNDIELPTKGLERIEAELSLCDKFTANSIADYLVVDTYELVKNLAKTANASNAAEVIAYRDGAIARNDAVINVLRKIGKNESDEFKNRITGRLQTKGEAKTENKTRTL